MNIRLLEPAQAELDEAVADMQSKHLDWVMPF